MKNIFKSISHFLCKNRRIYLSNPSNIVSFGCNRLCKKMSVNITGKDNIIKVGNNFKNKNIGISIEGEKNQILIGDNFKNSGTFKIRIIGSNNLIIIGNDVQIVSKLIIYNQDNSKDCKISIGNKTSFFKTEILTSDHSSSITIGDDCMFSCDTIVYNTDGHSIFQDGRLINCAKDLIIGNHVWCGWSSSILKNSYISDGCVVAKGAIVSGKFIDKNVIIAGVPAKVIKENIEWSRKSINETLNDELFSENKL